MPSEALGVILIAKPLQGCVIIIIFKMKSFYVLNVELNYFVAQIETT